MAAGKYNFLIEQGAHFNYSLDVSDDTGVSTDLTDYSGKMQIKSSVTASTSILELSSTGSYLSILNSTISLSVPNTVTSTLTFDTAVYDLIITSPVGVVTRLLEGSVNLSTQVTK